VGQYAGLKLFIEGIPDAVEIDPWVVANLSHPVNVGRALLESCGGRLKYTRRHRFLEIGGARAPLVTADTLIRDSDVQDSRLQAVFCRPEGRQFPTPHLVTEGLTSTWPPERAKRHPIPIFAHRKVILPPLSAGFVPCDSGGRLRLDLAQKYALCLEPGGKDMKQVLVLPGLCRLVGRHAYCLVMNLARTESVLEEGACLGTVTLCTLGPEEPGMPRVELRDRDPPMSQRPRDPARRAWLAEQLALDSNPLFQDEPAARERVLDTFEDYWETVQPEEPCFDPTSRAPGDPGLEQEEGGPTMGANPTLGPPVGDRADEEAASRVTRLPSDPWAFPMVRVRRDESGEPRWYIDYRELNPRVIGSYYPLLPAVGSRWYQTPGVKCFSTLASEGTNSPSKTRPEGRKGVTLVSPFGPYPSPCTPAGAHDTHPDQRRLVARAIRHLPPSYARAYAGAASVTSASLDGHLTQLQGALESHRRLGRTVRLSRCQLLQQEVEYLGYLVSEGGIAIAPRCLRKIQDWPLPVTARQLRRFLRFVRYYQNFLPDLADLTQALGEMPTMGTLRWSEAAKDGFRRLKAKFQEQPRQGHPDPSLLEPFVLEVGCSPTGMSATLTQVQDGKKALIGAYARRWDAAEGRYQPEKGEMAATMAGIRRFARLLRPRPFVLRVPHDWMQAPEIETGARGIYA